MDMSKSQRHTCLGPDRGVSQANEAAVHSKLRESCQHEIVSRGLKQWQCRAAQASCGCLVGHVCMGVRISIFAPYLGTISVPGLDEYADRFRI